MLIGKHRGPVTADLRRYYGIRLVTVRDDLSAGRLDLGELADCVVHLPPDSATARIIDPEWWATSELRFLRDIAYQTKWLVWAKTDDGSKNLNTPTPVLLTKAEQLAEKLRRDPHHLEFEVVDLDEARRRLGWDEKGQRIS